MGVRKKLIAEGARVIVRMTEGLIDSVLADKSNLAEEGYNDMPLRSVMAMLVHHTYFRDLTGFEEVGALAFGYNNVRARDYSNNHWTVYPCKATGKELEDLGLAFLIPNSSHDRNPNAPSLAVVLRGTILSRPKDISADIRIGIERLAESSRVARTMELILEVVEKFQKQNRGKRICMAGHSLGAAIALTVGGYLYTTHDVDIDTHLFNPPLLTVVNVVAGGIRPHSDDDLPNLEIDFSKLKETLVRDDEAMLSEWDQFKKLQSWIPKFYVNPGDPFCFRYINFYRSRQSVSTPGDVISEQGVFSSGICDLFKRNAAYFKNVVPSADLYISNWEDKDLRLAHSLRQWHKYRLEHIRLEDVYRARLLPQSRSPQRRYR